MILANSQFEKRSAGNPANGTTPRWPTASSPRIGVTVQPAVRLLRYRQWPTGFRTDASAPPMPGRTGRQKIRMGHCLDFLCASVSGQAAQGSTQHPTLPMPIILSATVNTHRQCLPGLPLGGRRSFRILQSSLRSAPAIPPIQPHTLYHGVQPSPRGRRLGQKTTGAAIQDR